MEESKIIACPKCGKTQYVNKNKTTCFFCGEVFSDKIINAEPNNNEEERERQKAIDKEQEIASKYTDKIIIASVVMLICIVLTIVFIVHPVVGDKGSAAAFGFFALMGVAAICAFAGQKKSALERIELAKKNLAHYQKLIAEEEAKAQAEKQREEAQWVLEHPKCPNCGSNNTDRISTLNRAASIAAVGLASSKIGKQYQCRNCGHKW